jgi:dihydroorotate dehydrogenase electron transfer subunit
MRPDSRMRFTEGEILRNEGHGGIFWRMAVAVPEPVEFVPGQFAMVSGWPGNDPLLPRPLAIFRSDSSRGRHVIEFVYKVVGRGTALLSGLHAGDRLSLTYPLGRGFSIGGEGRNYWLVGGGVGFSTVFPAAAALLRSRVDFEMFIGARTRDALPPREWTPGAQAPGRYHAATDDGTAGFAGRVSEAVHERMEKMGKADVARLTLLACGPWEMLKMLALPAVERGAQVQVALENRMACGFGVCWGCVVALRDGDAIAYRRVCREGPVFDAREVVW